MRINDPAGQWERFGRDDPYYGVVSRSEYRRENLTAERVEEFYASGARYVDWLFEQLGGATPRTALDFGCGVGRVLVPLARRSEQVTGVDISPAMLAECRKSCEARGIENVQLTEEIPDEQFDLVHTTIVLQHVPLAEGYRLIGELARHVSPGGVGALHVSLRASTLRARVFFAVTTRLPFAANLWNLLRRRPWSYPHMRMSAYRLDRVLSLLAAQGIPEIRAVYHRASEPMGFDAATLIFARARAAGSSGASTSH